MLMLNIVSTRVSCYLGFNDARRLLGCKGALSVLYCHPSLRSHAASSMTKCLTAERGICCFYYLFRNYIYRSFSSF